MAGFTAKGWLESNRNRFLLISVILIFLLLASFSFSNFWVDYKYNKYSGINQELDEIINHVDNETLRLRLVKINEELGFINAVCFN